MHHVGEGTKPRVRPRGLILRVRSRHGHAIVVVAVVVVAKVTEGQTARVTMVTEDTHSAVAVVF